MAPDRRNTVSPEADTPASGHGSDGMPAGEPEAPVAPTAEAGSEPQAPAAPAGAASTEPEADVEDIRRDLDELTAKARKADEYLELAQRTKADFENYRKRAAREAAVAQERGVIKLVRELLPAVDNLDRAVAALNGGTSSEELASGVKLVHDELIAALNRAGVELFSPQGEHFDPERHEAVAQQPVEGVESGTIVEVYQRGCRLGDSVIRPARVVVAG